jgi:hypothetical protein
VTIFNDGMDVTFPLTLLKNTATDTTSGPASGGPWNFKVTTDSSIGNNQFSGVQDTMPLAGSSASSTASSPLPVAPPSGMLLWLPEDGYPTDIQGAHQMFLANISYAASEVGQSFVFNGNHSFSDGSFVTVTASDLTPPAVTVDFWFKSAINLPDANHPHVPLLYKLNIRTDPSGTDDANAVSKGYDFFYQFGALGFGLPSTTGGLRTTVYCSSPSCQTITANTWHHVAGTYDGRGQYLFFDGQLVGSGDNFGAIQYQPADIQLGVVTNTADFSQSGGVNSSDHNYFFGGQIDEVEIFNRGLSASEVQSLYSAGSAGKARP